jgi:hypothetical protein
MAAAFEVIWAFAIVVGLWAMMALVFYGFCWTVLSLVQFFPLIGRRHRHAHWHEMTRRSARGRVSS